MNISDLIIDEEFESVIPPLTDEEFELLKESVLNDGEVYHPLVVWNNIIVDGHHRYKILKEHFVLLPTFCVGFHEIHQKRQVMLFRPYIFCLSASSFVRR